MLERVRHLSSVAMLRKAVRRIVDALSSRPGAFILAGLVTSLMIPAVTKQWSDRETELKLKERLVASIGTETATFIDAGWVLVGNLEPAARFRGEICKQKFKARQIYGYQDTAKLFPDCRAAIFREDAVEAPFDIAARKRWDIQSAAVSAKLAAYFPRLDPEWRAYASRVDDYYRIAIDIDCNANYERLRGPLRQYDTALYSSDLLDLRNHKKCFDYPGQFARAYRELGHSVEVGDSSLVRDITLGQAVGFSHGVSGVASDALPFAIIFGAAALVIGLLVIAAAPNDGAPPPKEEDR